MGEAVKMKKSLFPVIGIFVFILLSSGIVRADDYNRTYAVGEPYTVIVGDDSIFDNCNINYAWEALGIEYAWSRSELQEAESYGYGQGAYYAQAYAGVAFRIEGQAPASAKVSMRLKNYYSFTSAPMDPQGDGVHVWALAAVAWTDPEMIGIVSSEWLCHLVQTGVGSMTCDGADVWVERRLWLEPGKTYWVYAIVGSANYDADPLPGGESESHSLMVVDEVQIKWYEYNPLAYFTYTPQNPRLGELITFDASRSYDSDGEIVKYEWGFGDGNTTEGMQVIHAYNETGNYTVTLTVTDNEGLKDYESKTIEVKEVCIPLMENGPHYKKINIVFVPDKDYYGNVELLKQLLKQHALNKINLYGNVSPIKENIDNFNFYYTELEGDYANRLWIPEIVKKECDFANAFVLLHVGEKGDYALQGLPSIFSSEGYYPKKEAFLHESGHAVFGLADEYNDERKEDYTHYSKPDPYPNIWESYQACIDYANESDWNASLCRLFCTYQPACGGGWWKIDIGNLMDYGDNDPDDYPDDIMTWGQPEDGFGISSSNRILWVFNSIINRPQPRGYPDEVKNIMLELEMKNSTISEIDSEITYGEYPNYIELQGTEFNIYFYSENHSILERYGMYDPRIALVENDSNISSFMEDINFTLVLPYIENLSSVEIVNSTESLISFNISEKMKILCEEKDGFCDSDCGVRLDADWPDGDVDLNKIVDIFDLAAVGLSYGSKSGDTNWNQNADLNSDGKVNIFDLATVGLNYGKSC